MSEMRIGRCSCGAQVTSPYSSDVNNFLETHNGAHNGIQQGEITGDLPTPQSNSEKHLASIAESLATIAKTCDHINKGEVWIERTKAGTYYKSSTGTGTVKGFDGFHIINERQE
jgi:hypothetical protein